MRTKEEVLQDLNRMHGAKNKLLEDLSVIRQAIILYEQELNNIKAHGVAESLISKGY